MANFYEAYEIVKKNEGGYVNDLRDSGGETYRGIARKRHPKWKGWSGIDALKKQYKTKESLKRFLDKTDVFDVNIQQFYYKKFWKPIWGDHMVAQEVANSVFDFAVNAGVKRSVKKLQACLGVSADGIVGKQTMGKLNEVCDINNDFFSRQYLVLEFFKEKIKFYHDLCRKRKKDKVFLYGWVKRSLHFT